MTPLEFFVYGTMAVLAWWLLLEVTERNRRTEWPAPGPCPARWPDGKPARFACSLRAGHVGDHEAEQSPDGYARWSA